jgi:hypothetical protein
MHRAERVEGALVRQVDVLVGEVLAFAAAPARREGEPAALPAAAASERGATIVGAAQDVADQQVRDGNGLDRGLGLRGNVSSPPRHDHRSV